MLKKHVRLPGDDVTILQDSWRLREALQWADEAQPGEYLAAKLGLDDLYCGYTPTEITQIRARLAVRGLSLNCDHRGLVAS